MLKLLIKTILKFSLNINWTMAETVSHILFDKVAEAERKFDKDEEKVRYVKRWLQVNFGKDKDFIFGMLARIAIFVVRLDNYFN